jgi:hypothetical protein
MPVHGAPGVALMKPDRRAVLDYMPGSEVPVIRQRFEPGDRLPYWCVGQPASENHCYRPLEDPAEEDNRLGSADERDMIELLRVALASVEAPAEHFQRLGIA